MNFAARCGAALAVAAGLVCWCAAVSAQQGTHPSAQDAPLPRKPIFGATIGPVTKEVGERQKLDRSEGVLIEQILPDTLRAWLAEETGKSAEQGKPKLPDPAEQAQIEEYMAACDKCRHFSGAVLVARDGKILLSKGYGLANREHDVPCTPQTKFRTGSISKPITALAVMLLQERGKLDVGDRIKKYLPDLPAAWDEITIHYLLTHRSGIPDITRIGPRYMHMVARSMTPGELVDTLRDKPLLFRPGEKGQYSNSNYILLGMVIEKVSGQHYDRFLEENIFRPLGMKDTGFDRARPILKHRAAGYGTWGFEVVNAAPIDLSVPFAAGGLYSTTEDLFRLDQALYTTSLVSPKTLESIFTPHKVNVVYPHVSFGYGWGVAKVFNRKWTLITHLGGINGFTAIVSRYPEEQVTVIALSNCEGTTISDIVFDLGAIILGERYKTPTPSPTATVGPEVLDTFTGQYELDDKIFDLYVPSHFRDWPVGKGTPKLVITATRKGPRLLAQIEGQSPVELAPESQTRFICREAVQHVTFVRDKEGKVTHLRLDQPGGRFTAEKLKTAPREPESNKNRDAKLSNAARPPEKAPSVRKESLDDRTELYKRYLKVGEAVKWNPVHPHWLADGNRFWYPTGSPERTTIYLVDPETGTRQAMFDAAKVRKAMAVAVGREPAHAGLPFARFTFVGGETKVRFAAEGKHWELDRAEGTLTEVPAPAGGEVGPKDGEVASPDGRLFAREKDHNIYLRKAGEERGKMLTDDGTLDEGWIVRGFDRSPWRARWSPDGSRLATFRVDQRRVPSDPIVHFLKPVPEVTYSHRSPPGEPIPHSIVYVFHAATGKRVRIDSRPDEDRYVSDLHWLADGATLLLLRGDREQKRIEVLSADPETGTTRVILTESSKTWVGMESFAPRGLTPLSGGRFLWASERDGWNHLYLYDRDGRLLRRLTSGDFPVVRVLAVDEKAGWVYFAARSDRERPYDTHLCRVNLEGRCFTRLTEVTGQHGGAGIYELYPAGIDFSPSRKYFIDTHSDLDRPYAADLRAADGRLVFTLERADVRGLASLKWKPPESFVVKAADGTTDIHGVLYKPSDFDSVRKYPVLDHIYNAPWAMWVPKTFNSGHMIYTQALAQLGFVIVVVDGRGTPNRGKAFHDLIHGRQYRIEVADHVAAIKQLAQKRPYLDLTRVGIFGGSNGGYLAVRALLTEPDFFRAAAALAPPVDRASMGADFQEPYLGLPARNPGTYERLSLVPLAGKLKGKLLLAHGTADENVPLGGTMRLASALIEAGKDFDFLILPGQGHDPTGRSLELWQEQCRRHFQNHLRP